MHEPTRAFVYKHLAPTELNLHVFEPAGLRKGPPRSASSPCLPNTASLRCMAPLPSNCARELPTHAADTFLVSLGLD